MLNEKDIDKFDDFERDKRTKYTKYGFQGENVPKEGVFTLNMTYYTKKALEEKCLARVG